MEFVGTLPLLAVASLACLQALLVALAMLFAQSAVDRAARGAPSSQVRASIPSGWRERASVQLAHGRASVRIVPPSVLPGVGARLAVRASSEAMT